MAVARRLIASIKLDDYVPQAILCMQCQSEVDLTKAHFGRIIAGWIGQAINGIDHVIYNGLLHQIPTVTEHRFPRKITGYCCEPCYIDLYNTTWREKKTGHLRRAFETLHQQLLQPANDDYDAASVTKGLYAPHIGKRKGKVKENYHTAPVDRPSAIINNPPDRKLKGFNRPERDDIKLKPKRTIVRSGKWKVDPVKYNYQKPK